MELGLVCQRKGKGFKKGYTGVKAVKKRSNDYKLIQSTLDNIEYTMENIIWCLRNDVLNYRVSSSIIPFPEFWDWESNSNIINRLAEIKDTVYKLPFTLTIHPDQYTVLNTKSESTLSNTLKILNHHTKLCKLMGIDHIILHTGGVYGDICSAKRRFADRFNKLDNYTKSLIRLENCKLFSPYDIIDINKMCGVDICFDLHHARVNDNSFDDYNVLDTIMDINIHKTVCHMSSGKTGSFDNSHHNYIVDEDVKLIKDVFEGKDVILEIEAKHKDLSIIKLKKDLTNN